MFNRNSAKTFLILLSFFPNASSAYSYIFKDGWYVQVEPFYVQATDTLLSNSVVAVKVPDPKIHGDFKELYHLNLGENWGGRFAVGYNFCSHPDYNYGLSLEYTIFDNKYSAFIENNSRNSAGLPVIAPGELIDITDESSAKFSTARSKFKQKYDTLDLLAEKNILAGNCTAIKIYGGIRYFHLSETLNHRYEFVGEISTIEVENLYQIHFDNELNSVGPHLGTRLFYNVGYGFGIGGQLAGSLLCGESKSKFFNSYHLAPTSPLGDATDLTSSNHHEDAAHIVPAISGKVGIIYHQLFCHCTYVEIEAGYRGDRYFNAANDTAYQQLIAGDDINSNSNYQDFDLSGPYFSVTIHG